MNEKKALEVSLSTFLSIITIVIILIVTFLFHIIYNGDSISTEKMSSLNNHVDSIEKQINSSKKGTISSNNSGEYQIKGRYYQENAKGDEPTYTFSANNKVTYGALWICGGTYTINQNIIKINFTSALDPDGNKAKIKDFGVNETVTLTIINNNKLKNNSTGVVYSKQKIK